jgi:glycoside/pentoside/hexuronide:cation symporter, GPH family
MVELTTFQRVLCGVASAGIISLITVQDGFLIYHYNSNKGVASKYLSMSNFLVGTVSLFVAIGVGNLSNRLQIKYQRKLFVLMCTPFYAIALFLRYGAFSKFGESSALYYLLTYSVEVAMRIALAITNDAWMIELTSDDAERSKLFSVAAAVGLLGVVAGLGLALLPLLVNGFLISLIILISGILNICFLPDDIRQSKRASIPTVANISSVLSNSQFRIFFLTMLAFWMEKSVPSLFLFFLRYVVDLEEEVAKETYTFALMVYVLCGALSIPIYRAVADMNKLTLNNMFLLGAIIVDISLFAVSYSTPIAVIIALGPVGFFSTLNSTVLKIIRADIVDYDELLTGKKRGAVYVGLMNPVSYFLSVAGVSFPLAIMSLCGFDPSESDSGGDDEEGVTRSGVLVLRLWCTLVMAVCATISLLLMRQYKVSREI